VSFTVGTIVIGVIVGRSVGASGTVSVSLRLGNRVGAPIVGSKVGFGAGVPVVGSNVGSGVGRVKLEPLVRPLVGSKVGEEALG